MEQKKSPNGYSNSQNNVPFPPPDDFV